MLGNGNLKLYFQLYLKLRDQIFHGDLVSGSDFPTIENLQQQYDISKETVRKALNLLEIEGLITRKQGNVAVVRQDVDLNLVNDPVTREDAWTRTKGLKLTMLSSGWEACPQRLMDIFSDPQVFNDLGQVFKCRVMWQSEDNSRRKSLMDVYIPRWQLDNYDPHTTIDEQFYFAFQKQAYLSLMKVVITIRPCICDAESSKALGLPEGTPLFSKQKIHMDGKGQVLAITEGMITANCLRLVTQRVDKTGEIVTYIKDDQIADNRSRQPDISTQKKFQTLSHKIQQ